MLTLQCSPPSCRFSFPYDVGYFFHSLKGIENSPGVFPRVCASPGDRWLLSLVKEIVPGEDFGMVQQMVSGLNEDLAHGLQLVSGSVKLFINGFESPAGRTLMLYLSSKDGVVK